jgi:hypothetical protein
MLIFSINPETIRSKNSSRLVLATENQLLVIAQMKDYCAGVRLPLVPSKRTAPNMSTVKDEI